MQTGECLYTTDLFRLPHLKQGGGDPEQQQHVMNRFAAGIAGGGGCSAAGARVGGGLPLHHPGCGQRQLFKVGVALLRSKLGGIKQRLVPLQWIFQCSGLRAGGRSVMF